ncbi:hypothetical protein HYW43_01715 [Candidatus Daviesbacteria bacterium]|nr:hypothetical protein [Candidatus Daviesbacteria bacterium]
MNKQGFIQILIVLLIVGALGGSYILFQKQAAKSPTSARPAVQPIPTLATNPQPTTTTDETPVSAPLKDLAKKLGVETSQIQLVSVEKVEWRDSSLGCPKQGEMYAQVISPGYKIIFEYQGKQYEYHTDEDSHFVSC